MATAPPPGVGRRANAKDVIIRISDGEAVVDLHLGLIGPRDDLLVRRESGLTLPQLIEANTFDSYSLVVLWWLARVKSGEETDGSPPRLNDVLDQFPTYDSLASFTVERIEPDEAEPTPEA